MRGRRTADAALDEPEERSHRDRPDRILAALRGEQALSILDASGDAVLVVASAGAAACPTPRAAGSFAAPTAVLAGHPAVLLVPQLAGVVRALADRRAA